MSQLLATYTVPLHVSQSLLTEFFSKVVGKVTIPDTHVYATPKSLRAAIRSMDDELRVWNRALIERYAFENFSDQDYARIEYLQKTILHFEMALNGYPQLIDMSFLSERRGDYPYFGVTTIYSSGMEIRVFKDRSFVNKFDTVIKPSIPQDLATHFQVTCDHLASLFNHNEAGEIFIASAPSGKMGVELTKRLGVSERSGLFTGGIFVVFQADWELNKLVVKNKDPLIIGCRQTAHGPMYYLIGMYDPTPMEEWVVEQHSKMPKK